MTDYIVANCETEAFNGLYEYDDGTYGLTNPPYSYAWIKWDGNGHTVPDNIIAVIGSDWTVGQPYITDFDNTAHYNNGDYDNTTVPTAPDDPSIVWFINHGDPSTLTVTAAGGEEPEPPAKKYRYKPISQLTGRIGQLGY